MASLSPAELDARLRLHALPELGAVRQRLLLDAFGSAAAALSAPASAWRALRLPAVAADARRTPATRERVDQTLAWLDGPERHLLCLGDDRYPALLAEIADPPPLLFVEGQVALLEWPQLALVGSRQASAQGLDNARRFAHSLAAAGFCITSGLARASMARRIRAPWMPAVARSPCWAPACGSSIRAGTWGLPGACWPRVARWFRNYRWTAPPRPPTSRGATGSSAVSAWVPWWWRPAPPAVR